MTTRQQNQRLSEIEGKPTLRIIDGVSIRFVESDPGDSDALLLSPWPESVFAQEPTWSRLAETTRLGAIDSPGFGRSERKDALMSPRDGRLHRSRGRRTRRVVRRHVDPDRYDRAIMRTACL